ncbi:MAG: Ig domain-containing protein [Faecalibacterium prausnitzii]|nr:Ig domain-containing protein [Faecalibacterium prausnitzii]
MISLRFFRKNKVILVHIFLTFELAFPGCFLQYLQPALRRQTGHNRLIFDTNHGLFSDSFQAKIRGSFLSEKGRLAKCLTRQILNKKVCTSAHCRSALQSGQRQTQNQTKGVFTMQINITARDFGGTEFLAQPHRLHLGAQKAEGVDRLEFSLPEQWKGCVVTLHIRHTDGTLAEPLALDETGCVSVGRSFTGWASGEWMLAAANGNGYIAYTRPGQYDVHGILPTEGAGEELTPSVYEQFIARVMASANAAAEAAKRAASGEANAKQSASEAASSAQQTAASATLAAGYAEQAEAAADRAAAYAPSEGAVLSVNGKGGTVRLNALDVWALPRPVSPKAGQLVRVVKVDASTGALTADTISTDSLSGLGSEEKALLLKLLSSASYTDSSARDDLEALKKLWDTTPPAPLPDPDIIPVEKVTLSQHTLELSRGSTADLSASIAPPDATDQTVLWSVSPTDIVSVDAGRVTALKKGSAVVTATSDSKSDSCTVTVTPAVYRIETAHTDSGDIPAWDTYPAKYEFFMPLTAKKAGLLLRSLEFRVKGYVPGTMRTVLRKYGSTTALADKFIDIVRGYNDVVLDMGSIALEKGVEYQLYFAASNNFYPPSVQPSWVAANDCIDIAHGSAYYGDDTTLIFSGTVVLQET